MENTVTKLELKLESPELGAPAKDLLIISSSSVQENRFLDRSCRLTTTIREDDARILYRYPSYDEDLLWPPTIPLSEIRIQGQITESVAQVAVVNLGKWPFEIAAKTAHPSPEIRIGLRDVASVIQQINLYDNKAP